MRFRCGALVIEVSSHESHDDLYWKVFEGFASEAQADVTVSLHVSDKGWRNVELDGPITWHIDHAAGAIDIGIPTWVAHLDLGRREVEATLASDQVRTFAHLLAVVTQVYTTYLKRGLNLHASAVVRDGRAVVFTARSETGKSTVARISKELGCLVLTEEMACVFGLGEGDVPVVQAMPLRERGDLLVKEPVRAPLAAVYSLAQANDTSVEELDRMQQVKRIAMASAIGVRDALLMEPALEMASQLVDRVPVKLLHFERSPRLWEVVDADLRQG